ncbi:hypothetical protein ACKKBG_A06155 [Auxenochlorella protothecoides x Auxenochlorella symbiontica]
MRKRETGKPLLRSDLLNQVRLPVCSVSASVQREVLRFHCSEWHRRHHLLVTPAPRDCCGPAQQDFRTQ